ncbi:MAG: nuclear transport factor 2 family protein [Acidimicrobiales bacterium]
MTDTSPETVAANVALVTDFWAALGRRDFAAVGAFMADDGHYVDVPVIGIEDGAYGPAETTARLTLGIAPLQAYELHDGPIVASGDLVVTEHRETWTWDDDHTVTLPFTSVMEVRDGKVARWWDYLDLATLTNAAPAWWLDHIAPGYK